MKLYHRQHGQLDSITLTLELVPQDLWVGAYYRVQSFSTHRIKWRPWQAPFIDVYVCLVPTVVFHYRRVK